MAKIKGYRTLIVSGFLVAYALAGFAGIDVPQPDGEQALALSGALMFLFRFLTDGPVRGGSGE